MELETYLHSHILGGLYGQVLGNAWAMPTFIHPTQTWDYYHGWLASLTAAPDDHPLHAGYQAGQITGRVQQALALGRAIIADGEVTLEGTARSLVAWYDQVDGDNNAAISLNTRQAVTSLKAGADPHTTGLHSDSSDSFLQISSVGLIHPGDPEAAVQDSLIACTPAHANSIAVSGACAIAAAIARAMTPNTTLEDIIDAGAWGADVGRQHGAPRPGASIARKIDFAVQLATDTQVPEYERIQNLYDLIGATLDPTGGIPCVFGILAIADGDPVQTAMYAATLSGAADAIGAMAGAIAGAWYSIDSIPAEDIEILHQANSQVDIEEMAEGLYEIAVRNFHNMPQSEANFSEQIQDV